jgi:hypothetical protein
MPITLKRDDEFTKLLRNNLAECLKHSKRPDDLTIHVSDILPSSCLRKQYYSRKFPELDPLTDDMVHYYTKGLASEHVITSLAGMEPLKFQSSIQISACKAIPTYL